MNSEIRNQDFPARQRLDINWGTGTFLVVAHAARRRSSLFLELAGGDQRRDSLLGCRQSWYRHGLSPADIRTLQFLGLARAIMRVRFNRATSAWQLVRGRRSQKIGQAMAAEAS